VNVDARVDVVQQIPADMVGVFVQDEIIATIPTPVSGKRPIPVGDLEIEATGEPETVVVAVNVDDAVAVGRAEVFKVTVLEGVVNVEAFIIRCVVAIPVIVTDMLGMIDRTVLPMLLFPLEVLGVRFRRGGRDASLIGARRILVVLLMRLRRLSGRLGPQNRVRTMS
jgi:hypothetical protein